MVDKIVKMSFPAGVHFGKGMLTDGDCTFQADTFFSALCQEAACQDGGIEALAGLVRNGNVRISDGLPYIHDTLYLPKPYLSIQGDDDGDSVIKKAFKKLSFIPMDQMDKYLAGKLDAVKEGKTLAGLGTYEMRNSAAINRGKDADPYHVGIYHFSEGCGLYICISCEDKQVWNYMEELIKALSCSGIGGRRSEGLGRFTYTAEDCPAAFVKRLRGSYKTYMTISIALPEREELDDACEGSSYSLVKRSGYVASAAYAEDFLKKRDFYAMSAGSVFTHAFKGGLYDVSFQGKHPVYRYAYPMLVGLK